jgi:archaellum component FlaD/FlaE
MFNAPQPLYSITQDQSKYKFRQPPEIDDFDEIATWYIERLSRENVMDDVLHVLEYGMPLDALTRLLIRSAVGEGVHTIEKGFLVRPVVFEYLKGLADAAEIEYKETFSNKAESEEKALGRAAQMVKKNLKGRKKDEGVEMLMAAAEAPTEEMPADMEQGMEEEMPTEEAPAQMEMDLGMEEQEQPQRPAGLMARG